MILINGDSYTAGVPSTNNYPHHSPELWPGKFQELCKKEILNVSEGGSSNYRLFRTTIEQIYRNELSHVIIGWSHKDRFEFPHKNGNYIKVKPTSNVKKHHATHKEMGDLDLKYLHYIYYNTMFNEERNIEDLINFVLILQDLCELKNIKLINFQSFYDNFEDIHKCSLDIQSLFSKINQDQWIPSTMKSTLEKEGYGKYKSNWSYPDAAGNRRWAEIINNFISMR